MKGAACSANPDDGEREPCERERRQSQPAQEQRDEQDRLPE
jgi:hypothetical protein